MGDSSTPFHIQSWKPLVAPGGYSDEVVVDNLETVSRFKKTLYRQVCPRAEEGFEDSWPELALFRKTNEFEFEAIEGDQEALYMFALKDGDRVVLLVQEGGSSRTEPPIDPVRHWVESMRAQAEFEAVEAV
ncbi:hypothetical protein EC968_003478 [Mortierella alpina]|nr:hypothetical protein EC968_003478 [Mortierella alpina]